MAEAPDGRAALGRVVFVLYQPQDLVNVALIVRAMKNMELTRLRLVSPAEYDEKRIDGIAHDTQDVVERIKIYDDFDAAVADVVWIAATTARRRMAKQEWAEPAEAVPRLLERTADGDVAIVFGREDKGLPNSVLDRCHEALCIPTNPDHASLNLGHAGLLIAYELRQAARGLGGLEERDLSAKPRDQAPPATAEQMEDFFRVWKEAMGVIGMYRGVRPTQKMRSYRRIFKRADMDEMEMRLMEATSYRIVHYAKRMRKLLAREVREELEERKGPDGGAED